MAAQNRSIEIIRQPLPWLLLVSMLGAYLRIHDLALRSLWFDEAVLFHIANNPFGKVIAANAAENSAPPLYALLLHLVMAFGTSEAVLRSVSCLAGILSVPLIFFLARLFVAPPLAVFSSLLVALSPQQIYYSTQLREYSLAFALTIWLMLAAYRLLEGASLGRALHLGMVFCIAIFSQYGLGLLIVALDLVCAVSLVKSSRQTGRDLLLFGMAQLIGALAVFWVYRLGLREQFGSGGFGAHYLAHGYGDGTWHGFLNLLGNTGNILSFAFPSLLFPLLCCLGVLEVFRERKTRDWYAINFLAVPFSIILGAATMKWYPYLGERQGILLTPMLYVFAAIGLSFLHRVSPHLRALQVLLVLGIVSVGIHARTQPDTLSATSIEDLRPVVKTLTTSSDPSRDLVYVYYGAIPAFRYYMQGMDHPWVAGISSRGNLQPYFRQLDELLASNRRLWLVFSHAWQNEPDLLVQYIQTQQRQVYMAREEKGAWLLVAEPKPQ